jgi:hypothetical protein
MEELLLSGTQPSSFRVQHSRFALQLDRITNILNHSTMLYRQLKSCSVDGGRNPSTIICEFYYEHWNSVRTSLLFSCGSGF